MRKAELIAFNHYYKGNSGVEKIEKDEAIIWQTNDSDSRFANFVFKCCRWLIYNATGECDIRIRINPTDVEIIKRK